MYNLLMLQDFEQLMTEIIKPRCACAARAYGSRPVCVCVYVCVCYSNICSTAAFWLKVSVFLVIHHVFLDFDW